MMNRTPAVKYTPSPTHVNVDLESLTPKPPTSIIARWNALNEDRAIYFNTKVASIVQGIKNDDAISTAEIATVIANVVESNNCSSPAISRLFTLPAERLRLPKSTLQKMVTFSDEMNTPVLIKIIQQPACDHEIISTALNNISGNIPNDIFTACLAKTNGQDAIMETLIGKVNAQNAAHRIPLLLNKNGSAAMRTRLTALMESFTPEPIKPTPIKPTPIYEDADELELEELDEPTPIKPTPIKPTPIKPTPKPTPKPTEPDVKPTTPPLNDAMKEKAKNIVHDLTLSLRQLNPKDEKLTAFIAELITHGEAFIEDNDLDKYKRNSMDALTKHKPGLSPGFTRSLTLFEHISEALRSMFNVLDKIVSYVTLSQQTMAEKGSTPGAQFLRKKPHFFNKPDTETSLGQAMREFENNLKTLQNNGGPDHSNQM